MNRGRLGTAKGPCRSGSIGGVSEGAIYFRAPAKRGSPLPPPLIADSAVLSAINTRMVTPRDFIRAGQSVARLRGVRAGSAARNAVGLAGESPVVGIDCLPT